jgi:hypothetical protein
MYSQESYRWGGVVYCDSHDKPCEKRQANVAIITTHKYNPNTKLRFDTKKDSARFSNVLEFLESAFTMGEENALRHFRETPDIKK